MAEQRKKRVKTAKVKRPDPIPLGLEIIDVKKRKWIFGKEIGTGGCGVVYEGSNDSSSSFDFVIKVECHENGPLYSETYAYHAFGKQELINQFIKKKKLNFLGIPVCHSTGSFEYNNVKCRYLVLPKFGRDLRKVLDENNNTLHPKTVFTVGCIVINALEYLHSFGYVHQDIKAENLMLGRTAETLNHVYLLDMGLATRYITKSNEHKDSKRNPGRAHNGTAEFISRDGHNGVFSRRSDLEILGYNMLLWLAGTLPWKGIEIPEELMSEKDRWMHDVPDLMDSLFPQNGYPELEEFLLYVSKLGFEETPRYDLCVTMFRRALKSLGIKDDGILILKESGSKKPVMGTASDSSQKENNVKKGERKKRVNRDASTSSSAVYTSGEVLTPAMLAVLNRQQEKAAEKAVKKPKKKAS